MEKWRNLWRNDRRRNVFEQVARHDDFVVDGDGESVVGIHFQPVDVRLVVAVFLLELAVVRLFRRRAFRDLSSDWILVAKDEVQGIIKQMMSVEMQALRKSLAFQPWLGVIKKLEPGVFSNYIFMFGLW